jgi:hypothetical protein
VIAMIEAPFGTAAMTLARGTHRGVAGRRATRRRAVRVAAITRGADREEAIAAATDLLAERRIHDVEAAARFDWTRRSNRGTRETTGSVRRSIEAVIEGLEGQAPGLHLNPAQACQPTAIQYFEGALGGTCFPSVGVITTAAERLQGSSTIAESGGTQNEESIDQSSDLRGFR